MEDFGDLNVISILMGRQGVFTKHYCFLCLWDSCATTEHCVRIYWPQEIHTLLELQIPKVLFVDPKDAFMPSLYAKLELIKNFVKTLGKSGSNGFAFLCNKFLKISKVKMKEGSFVGSQIREVLKDSNFE